MTEGLMRVVEVGMVRDMSNELVERLPELTVEIGVEGAKLKGIAPEVGVGCSTTMSYVLLDVIPTAL